jgi:hypothetical protein
MTRSLPCALVLASTLGCRGEAPPSPTQPAMTAEPELTSPGPSIDPASGFVRVELPELDANHQTMLAAIGELGPLTILVRGSELESVRDALAATSGYADAIGPLLSGTAGLLANLAASAGLATAATLDLIEVDPKRPVILSLFEPALTPSPMATLGRYTEMMPVHDGIRHQVVIPVVDVQARDATMEALASWLAPVGRPWPELVDHRPGARAWSLERPVEDGERAGLIALLPGTDHVRVVFVDRAIHLERRGQLELWRARLETAPSELEDSAALRLALRSNAPLAAVLRPDRLPMLEATYAAEALQDALEQLPAEQHPQARALGFGLSLAALFPYTERDAELEDIGLTLAAEGDVLRLRAVAGLTQRGLELLEPARASTGERVPALADPWLADVGLRLEPAYALRAGDDAAIIELLDPDERRRSCWMLFCGLHDLGRRPITHMLERNGFEARDRLLAQLEQLGVSQLRLRQGFDGRAPQWVATLPGTTDALEAIEDAFGHWAYHPKGIVSSVDGQPYIAIAKSNPESLIDAERTVDALPGLLNVRADADSLYEILDLLPWLDLGLELDLDFPHEHRPSIGELRFVAAFGDAALTVELVLTREAVEVEAGFAVDPPGLQPPSTTTTIAAGERCLRDAMRILGVGTQADFGVPKADRATQLAELLARAETALACAAEDPATREDAIHLRTIFTRYVARP